MNNPRYIRDENKTIIYNIIDAFMRYKHKGADVHLQGKVTDSNMSPVELATVSVIEQGKMTMTNLKGEFSIQLRSADSVVVRFSMVGYKTKTRVLRRPRGKQTLLIQLYDDNQLAGITVTEKRGRPEAHNSLKLRI